MAKKSKKAKAKAAKSGVGKGHGTIHKDAKTGVTPARIALVKLLAGAKGPVARKDAVDALAKQGLPPLVANNMVAGSTTLLVRRGLISYGEERGTLVKTKTWNLEAALGRAARDGSVKPARKPGKPARKPGKRSAARQAAGKRAGLSAGTEAAAALVPA